VSRTNETALFIKINKFETSERDIEKLLKKNISTILFNPVYVA